MSNNYGEHSPLSYNKYLKVPDLIGLQECLSDPLHHDELLFITIHQAYELWFKQILHELDATMVTMNEDRLAAAAPENDNTLDEDERRKPYGKRTQAVLEILTHFERRYEEFQLAEVLLEHDEYFSLWRSHHIKMVERMVGTKRGTGGSEGVGYLRTTLEKKFFPELWEARTYLDTKHGARGCPFAKD